MLERAPTRRDVLRLGSVALFTGLAGCFTESEDPGAQASESESEPEADNEYTRVYREAIDSVVLVETGNGRGTGFMFDESHVVTNAHVVGRSATTDVRFNEGQWSTGEVVGTDPHSDLAAIEVDGAPDAATPLPFIDGSATIGQEVVAIGNPFNLDGTLTRGIVSGTDRSIPAPTGYQIPDAIQTDAAVNPGNSGGPLMSLDGTVVAVINADGGENIAFGISAALTKRVVPRLIESGEYTHPSMGISYTDVTIEIARANGLDDPRGILVVETERGGPADGVLQPSEEFEAEGDIILAIDGTDITTEEDLMSYLALETRPGETVELTILRDGTEQSLEIELGTRSS